MGFACSAAKTLPEPSAKEPIKTASFKLQLLGTTPLSDENSLYAPSTSCSAEREPGRESYTSTCQNSFEQSSQEAHTFLYGSVNAKVEEIQKD